MAELSNEAGVLTGGDVIEIATNRFERRPGEEIGGLGPGVRSEFAALRAEIRACEARLTRWMFVLWIGQIGALVGILFAFFRT